MFYFYSFFLYFIFAAFSLLSAIFVIYTRNPIFSVLFLVFTFFNTACILLLFDFEFIPISFIVIYVGAIAVLFLFILMMLNLKLAELNESKFNFMPIAFFIGLAFLFELISIISLEMPLIDITNQKNVYYLFDLLNQSNLKQFLFSDLIALSSNVVTISKTLFNNYIFCFVISGFALLLAMMSAIILTLQKLFVSKNQNVYNQILKHHDKSLVHYN